MNLQLLHMVVVALLPHLTAHHGVCEAVALRQTSQTAAEISYHTASRGGQGLSHAPAQLLVGRKLLTGNFSDISKELSCDKICREAQRDALNQLFFAWDGTWWTRKANWTQANVSICHWEGVWCCLPAGGEPYDPSPGSGGNSYSCPNSDEVVLGLSLPSNNMSGALAAIPWSSLSLSLKLLHLDENRLTGGLTPLAPLSRLQHLSLSANHLTGTLQPLAPDPSPTAPPAPIPAPPPSPGDPQPSPDPHTVPLPQLTSLLLSDNQLIGELPVGLLRHPTLQVLDLGDNLLSGGIPSELLSGPSMLRRVVLAGNRLGGSLPTLPTGVGAAANLTHLDLSRNQLSGTLPRLSAALPALSFLDASHNRLGGSLGPLLPPGPALTHLALRNNSFNGSVPWAGAQLQHLDLSWNALSGTLPPSLGPHLATLLLSGNSRLTGPLPPGLTGLTSLNLLGTALQATQLGAAGLPTYLALSNSTYITHSSGPSGALCPLLILRPAGQPAAVSPYYWHYDSCICQSGYAAEYTHAAANAALPSDSTTAATTAVAAVADSTTPTAANRTSSNSNSQGPVVNMTCVAAPRSGGSAASFPWWVALLATAGGLALAVILLRLARQLAPSVERYRAAMARRMPPGFGRRAAGCQVTLVLTDVEGSTELWEWDTDVMATAIELHDHTLRSTLPKWQGYEVQTEGDAFLVAFHEPADALGWCISTQLLLLNANWDPELFRHHKAGILTSDSLLCPLHSNPLLAFSPSANCTDLTPQLISLSQPLPPPRPFVPPAPSALPQYLHPPSHTSPQSHPHPPPQSAQLAKLSVGPAPVVRPIRPLTQLGGHKAELSSGVLPASGQGMSACQSSDGNFAHPPTMGILLDGGSGRGGDCDGGLSLALGLGLSLELGPEGSGGSINEAQPDSAGRAGNGDLLDRFVPHCGRASTAAAAMTMQSGEPQAPAAAAAAAAEAEVAAVAIAASGSGCGGGSGRGEPAALATTFSGAFGSVVSGGEVGGMMVGASGVSFMDPCRTAHMMPLDVRPTTGPGGGSCLMLQDLLHGTATHGSASHDWCRFTRLGVQYRGLRVRMGVATGAADALRPHVVTQKVEYYGEVRRRLQAVADLPHGGQGLLNRSDLKLLGPRPEQAAHNLLLSLHKLRIFFHAQILIDAATFNATHNNLTDLSNRLLQLLNRTAKHARSFRARTSPPRSPDRSPFPSYTFGHSPHTYSVAAAAAAAAGGGGGGFTAHGSPPSKGPVASLIRWASLGRPATSLDLSRGHTRRPSSRHPLDLATAPEPLGVDHERGLGSSAGFFDSGGGSGGHGDTLWEGAGSVAGMGQRLLSTWRLVRPPSSNMMSAGPGGGGGGGGGVTATAEVPGSRPGSVAYRSNLSPLVTTSTTLLPAFSIPPAGMPSIPTGHQQRSPRPTPASGPMRQQLMMSSSPLPPSSMLPPIIQNVVSEPPPPPPFLQQQPSQLEGPSQSQQPQPPQQLLSRTISLPSQHRFVPRRMLGGFSSVDSGAVAAASTLYGSNVEALAASQAVAACGASMLAAYGSNTGGGGGANSTDVGDGSVGAACSTFSVTGVILGMLGSGSGCLGPAAPGGARGGGVGLGHSSTAHPITVLPYTGKASFDGYSSGQDHTGTLNSQPHHFTFVPEGQITRNASQEPQSAGPTYPAAPSPHPGCLTPSGPHPSGGLHLAPSTPHSHLRETYHTHTGRRGNAAAAVGIMAMGVFELHAGNSVEYISLTQVLVPGLEERARLSPPLDGSRQLTPGYLDAPAAAAAPLGLRAPKQPPLPEVAVVFCSLERYPEMVAVSRDLSYDVLAVFNDVVRRSLLACGGYECQEQEGHFMVAFSRPSEALEWCLMLQELVMEVAWTSPMLCLPGMQEQRHALTGAVLFRGPRVKAGLYGGVPTRVGPHPTTGRADYYGPLVNRAARFCHAAAQGGQVIVARCLLEDILREDLQIVTQSPVTVTGANTTTATTTVWHPAPGQPPALNSVFGPSTSLGSGRVAGPHIPAPAAWALPLRRNADLGTNGGGAGGLLDSAVAVAGGGHCLPRPQDIPPEALPLRLVATVDNSGVALSRWRMPADAAASSAGAGGVGEDGGGGGGGGGSAAAEHDDNGEVVVMGDPTTLPHTPSRTNMLTSHTSSRRRAALWHQPRRLSGYGNGVASVQPPQGAGTSGIPLAAGGLAAAATHAAAAASLELAARGNSRQHHPTRGADAAGGSSQRSLLIPRHQSCSGVGLPGGPESTAPSTTARGVYTASGSGFGGGAGVGGGGEGGGGGGGFRVSAGSHLKRTGSQPMLHSHAMTSAAVGTGGGLAGGRVHSAVTLRRIGKSSSTLAVTSVSSVCTAAASLLSAPPTLLRRSSSINGAPFLASPSPSVAVATAGVNAVRAAFDEEEVPPAEVILYDISPTSVPPIMRPILEGALAAVAAMSPRPTARGCGGSGGSGGDRSSAARGGGGGGGEQHAYVSRRSQMLLQHPASSSLKHPPTQPNQPALHVSPSQHNAAGLSRQSQMLRLLLPGSSMVVGSGSVPAAASSPTALPTLRPSGRSSHAALRRSSTVMYDSVPHSLPKLPDSCIRQRTGSFRWLWARELLVEDLGLFRFKGVAGAHHLVSVSTAATSERRAGPRLHTAKGERVEPGRGPLYRVVLQAVQPSINNDLARVQTAANREREGAAAAAASSGAGGWTGAGGGGGGLAGGGLSPIPGSGTTRVEEAPTEGASTEWPAPSPPPAYGRS